MKKQISILFLILIINLPFIGFYSVYKLQKFKIEKRLLTEIECGTSKPELVTLVFTRDQTIKKLNWLSKREFNYSGMIYKIIKVQYSGENIAFLCHRNYEAVILLRNFENLVKSAMAQNGDTHSVSDNLTNFLQCLFMQKYNSELTACTGLILANNYYYNKDLIFHYYGSEDPPPKFCTC